MERINEFEIWYMMNLTLHVNKAFKLQVINSMNNTFSALTQNFIEKKNDKKEYKCFRIINVSQERSNKY